MRTLVVGLTCIAALGVLLICAHTRAHASGRTHTGKLTLAPVVSGLTQPVFVAGPRDGSNRLFVLERTGLVRVADVGSCCLAARPCTARSWMTQILSVSNSKPSCANGFAPKSRSSTPVCPVT